MEIIRKYDDAQTEELRNAIIYKAVIPYMKVVFTKYPKFKSATLLVSQYWSDEAHDAVHPDVIFSALDTPDIQAAFELDKIYWDDFDENLKDSVNAPGDLPCSVTDYNFDDKESKLLWSNWPDNNDAIPAFAAYCKEGGNQEKSISENCTVYAHFKVKNNEVDFEVVGEMIRPWLNGVCPDWENTRDN